MNEPQLPSDPNDLSVEDSQKTDPVPEDTGGDIPIVEDDDGDPDE